MTVAVPSGQEQLEFLNKLQRILNEGSFVASYKYALLLSIAELCVEKEMDGRCDGRTLLQLDDIADRFVSLYWRQAAPFTGGAVLRHAAGGEASVVSQIRRFQNQAASLAAARRHHAWRSLVRNVARTIRVMPLWKLQRAGRDRVDFLYDEELVDGGILLRPGIAACFRLQFTVVQSLVQLAWLTFIQRLPTNQEVLGSTGDLADFLFGSQRAGLGSIVDGLADLQAGRCFYCDRPMNQRMEVDHFIPWSRYPRDLGHNFVLAHATCNRDKRDMLAAPVHLVRWMERNESQNGTLRQIFEGARFMYDLDASSTVAEWSYETAEQMGALVWIRKRGDTTRLTNAWREVFHGS